MSNVPTLKKIIKDNLNLEDPVILDAKFLQVKDSPTTRGRTSKLKINFTQSLIENIIKDRSFWNTAKKFYFIDRVILEVFDKYLPETNLEDIRYKNIRHLTYFDKNRYTYYRKPQNVSAY